MRSKYTKRIEYDFKVWDEILSITEIGKDYVFVEETRKNGQEDTHMEGCLVQMTDGNFAWENENFSEYYSSEFADEIREYLNRNGYPNKRKAK